MICLFVGLGFFGAPALYSQETELSVLQDIRSELEANTDEIELLKFEVDNLEVNNGIVVTENLQAFYKSFVYIMAAQFFFLLLFFAVLPAGSRV